LSAFWQHFEGQQPGQQQQHIKNDHMKSKITRPMTNAPANIPYACVWVCTSVIDPLEFPEISLLIKSLLL